MNGQRFQVASQCCFHSTVPILILSPRPVIPALARSTHSRHIASATAQEGCAALASAALLCGYACFHTSGLSSRRLHRSQRLARARTRHAIVAATAATTSASIEPRSQTDLLSDLVLWLQNLGASGLDGLSVAQSPIPHRGRVVFAKRDFEPGEELCKVPAAAILAVPSHGPEDNVGDGAEVSLAKALLNERHLGARSRLAPYIASLPAEGQLPLTHPLFWPQDLCLKELFAGSVHGQRMAAEVLKVGAAHVEALLSSRAAVNESEARWASAIVETRAFTFQPDTDQEQLALVPFLDMLNTFSLLRDGEALWQCSFEAEGPASEGASLVVDRPIRQNQEVLHVYNTNSSAMLWMTYGFIEDGDGENPFEVVGISVNLHEAVASDDVDVQRAKLAAVRAADLLVQQPLVFELPSDGELGGTLLPVARLLACRTAQEVGELAPTIFSVVVDGGAPKNAGLELEVRARRLVAEWLRRALHDSDTAMSKHQDKLVTGIDGKCSKQHQHLHELAERLLRRERPVLELELRACDEFVAEAAKVLQASSRDGGADSRRAAFEAEQWDDETGWLGAG